MSTLAPETNLADVGLPTRLVNALRGSGAETLADIARATRADLARLRCVGGKSLVDAERALRAASLSFATVSRWEHCGERLSREWLMTANDFGWMCLRCGAVARPLAVVAVDPRWQLDEVRAAVKAYFNADAERRAIDSSDGMRADCYEHRVRMADRWRESAARDLRKRLGARDGR